MKLNELSASPGSVKVKRRVGRGIGSGKGKRSGRGDKGQKSRSGVALKGFEGGQMPFYRRLPKRGFTNIFKTNNAVLNVQDLDRFDDGATIDKDTLYQAKLVKGRVDGIKILGTGDVSKKFVVKNLLVSKTAREKIEAAGGSVEQ